MANLTDVAWLNNLRFAEESYFLLFYSGIFCFIFLLLVLATKLIFRPKKSGGSRYRWVGPDSVFILALFLLFLSILAVADPRIPSGHKPSAAGSIDVIVVADETYSMRADDVKPSRHELMVKSSLYIVDECLAQGDRISLITLGKVPNSKSPLSEDFREFKSGLAEITHPEIYPDDSQMTTDLSAALAYAVSQLEKQDSYFAENSGRLAIPWAKYNRVMFIISDGDDSYDSSFSTTIKELNEQKVKVFSIGIGTRAGARVDIRLADPQDSSASPYKIYTHTSLSMNRLNQIAIRTGGDYFITDSEHKIPNGFIKTAIDSNRSLSSGLIYSAEEQRLWWYILAFSVLFIFVTIWFY